MNQDLYQAYKNKYQSLTKSRPYRDEAAEIYDHLKAYIKFDDINRKIYYKGDNIGLITCYFPRNQILWKKPGEGVIKNHYD